MNPEEYNTLLLNLKTLLRTPYKKTQFKIKKMSTMTHFQLKHLYLFMFHEITYTNKTIRSLFGYDSMGKLAIYLNISLFDFKYTNKLNTGSYWRRFQEIIEQYPSSNRNDFIISLYSKNQLPIKRIARIFKKSTLEIIKICGFKLCSKCLKIKKLDLFYLSAGTYSCNCLDCYFEFRQNIKYKTYHIDYAKTRKAEAKKKGKLRFTDEYDQSKSEINNMYRSGLRPYSIASKLNVETEDVIEVLIELDIKKCSKCDHILPRSDFSNSKNAKDGLVSYCKYCLSNENQSLELQKERKNIKRETPEEKQLKMLKMYSEFVNTKQIMVVFECSIDDIYYVLNEHNVSRCNCCKSMKPKLDFFKSSSIANGVERICKKCSVQNNTDREKTDRKYALRCSFGRLMNHSLKSYASTGKGDSSCFDLVDYMKEELFEHIESQFDNNKPHPVYGDMNWDNYGKWHLDHIVPVHNFNVTSPNCSQFKKCWGLENLQPLWAEDNLSKGNKLNYKYKLKYPDL